MTIIEFLSNFTFYNSIGLFGFINLYTLLEYISDSEHFTENMYNTGVSIGLWSFDKIVSIKMLYDDKLRPFFSIKNDMPNLVNIELFFTKEGILCKNHNIGEHTDAFIETQIDEKRVFVSEQNSSPKLYSTPQFFSFSLKYNNKTYDIYDKLKPFIVIGNRITPSFVIAFMKKYYNVEIPYDGEGSIPYVIEYMDTNFSNKTLEMNETILFNSEIQIKKRLSILIPSELVNMEIEEEDDGSIKYLDQSPIRRNSYDENNDGYDFSNILHSPESDIYSNKKET